MKPIAEWFQKSMDGKQTKEPESEFGSKENLAIQGSYTDYTGSPFQIRQQMSTLYGPELEAFDYVMEQMEAAHPECVSSQKDLIEWGFDEGWFIEGDQGELRVSEEPPV